MMALVLVGQSFYSVVQASAVYAAISPIVSPDAMHNWQTADNTGNGGSVDFVNTLGFDSSGSAQFNLFGTSQSQSLRTSVYAATKLSDITVLAYASNVKAGSTAAPSLRLAIDKDITDGDSSSEGWLIYSPYENGQVVQGQWQRQNAREGLWWFSDPAVFSQMCSQLHPCSLNTVITLYPNAGVASGEGVSFTVNGSEETSISNVDKFMFNDDTYDFEAITAPRQISPAHNSTLGDLALLATWQSVPAASRYIYESYNDEAATQLRVSEAITDTKKSETNLANGMILWWRVKAVDTQGDEGGWSELWKVTVNNAGIEGTAAVLGDGHAEELLTQMARLNEPFDVPNSEDTFIAPHVLNAIEAAGSRSDIVKVQVANSPIADHGVNTGTAVPTERGWKFFGVLWYWWVFLVGVLVFMIMRVSSNRSVRSFLYSSDQI